MHSPSRRSHHDSDSTDLRARAERAVREAGFETHFSPEALNEAAQLDEKTVAHDAAIIDLRHLLWSSIDNEESRDLDQLEYCETLDNGNISVRIAIADVAALVPPASAIDAHAAFNTASIYTGVITFPMLPERLSNDISSLLPGEHRLVVVTEMEVDAQGRVLNNSVYRALAKNHAKLVYESIGEWLDGETSTPPEVENVPGLEAQIRLQWEVAQRLLEARREGGALDVEPSEVRPVVKDGRVTDLQVPRKNPARLIIENFMVSVNMVLAQFLESRNVAAIQRVVREPQRWPRIVDLAKQHGATLPEKPDARALSQFLTAQRAKAPQGFAELSLSVVKLLGRGEYVVVRGPEDNAGHFGLGMNNYAHSTAPNRRYPDLITQRLVYSVLNNAPSPYSVGELESIAIRCSERESAAQKVERLMRKVQAASLFSDRIGQRFEAVVTGASPKGTYVRTLKPPVEGRVMRGEENLDVGDKVWVRLIRTDIERGFIDFEVD